MVRQRSREVSHKEIDKVVSDVTKEYGPNVMHRASRKMDFKHTPTGVFALDMALFGGVPEGTTTLMYGREGSGKTTLATRLVGQAQKKYPDKVAVFIDVEGTYNTGWAEFHGVDNTKLYLVQPQTGEQACDIADAVLRAEETSIVVVDTLAALIPFKEVASSHEDSLPGIQARLIGAFCRKVQNAMLDQRARQHYPTLILLNQWRMKIGVFMGDPRVLPGGLAQHYMAYTKIELKNKEHLGRDDRDIETVDHNDHSFKIAKCKAGTGIRSGEFKMVRNPSHPLGQGFIDDARTVATWAKRMGVITGGGSSWHIDGHDERFGNLQAICDYFYADLDNYEVFKRRLVTMQRGAAGLSTEGWY